MKNYYRIAEMAASIGSNKPTPPQIKSVPHIKKTKKQLEFIFKMPKPLVKWYEEDWVDGITVDEENKLYQKLMNEKKKNKYLKNILDKINTNTWKLYDLFQEKKRPGRMRDIRIEWGKIMYNLGHNVGRTYHKEASWIVLYCKHNDDFNLNKIWDRDKIKFN